MLRTLQTQNNYSVQSLEVSHFTVDETEQVGGVITCQGHTANSQKT